LCAGPLLDSGLRKQAHLLAYPDTFFVSCVALVGRLAG